MKESTNILLTSLSNQGDRKTHRYFYFAGSGNMKYCDGLSVGEAGAKYILNEVDIDEIIVLGSGRTYDKGEEMQTIELKEWSAYTSIDAKELSEYSFFQYRLAQFLDGIDMEAIDVLQSIDPARAEELKDLYQKFCGSIFNEPGYRPDRVFHMLSQDDRLAKEFIHQMDGLTTEEILWLKRYVYTSFTPQMKLNARDDNQDIRICFIPTSRDRTDNSGYAENVEQIIKVLHDIDAKQVNLYIDMQGLATTEGYTILAILTMLSGDAHNRLNIQEIITTHYYPDRLASPIDNREMDRYEINMLVSGMDAFIRYGKVDEIEEYWKSRNIENKHIDTLLYAMRTVDEGISLCSVPIIEKGIRFLKYVFLNTPKEELPQFESNIFRILENTIRNDYGSLLEGDKVETYSLLTWAMRKKFYQQSLTIIESRIPQEFVDKGIFYYADSEDSKEEFLEEINRLYWECAPKDRWGFDDMSHYFIKYYGRSTMKRNPASKDRMLDYTKYRMSSLDGKTEQLSQAYSVLKDNRPMLEKMLYVYYRIGEVRNHINHADAEGMDPSAADVITENKMLEELLESMGQFISTYRTVLDYLEEHKQEDLNVFHITKEELKEYTAAHKIFPNDNRRPKYSRDRRRNDRDKESEHDRDDNDKEKELLKDTDEGKKPEAAAGVILSAETSAEVKEKSGESDAKTTSEEKPKAVSSEHRTPFRTSYGTNLNNGDGRFGRKVFGSHGEGADRRIHVKRENSGKPIRITIEID